MVSVEGLLIAVGWLTSVGIAFAGWVLIPKRAAKRMMAMFGLTEVTNAKGDPIYAVMDPDGEPVKVPVARLGKDGKVAVTEEYAPLAYSLPTIAAMQVKASFQGKVGKLTQQANAAALEGMPVEQAAQAMALTAFAQGKYGRALMALLAPKIAASINASGNAGKQQGSVEL